MKTVKLYYVGFWYDFDFQDNLFSNILKKRYNVVLDDKDPDFLICSPLGKPFDYMKYSCPRIMYTGEFLSADFTAFDYFIGYDDISFGDRAMRFPLFLFRKNAQPRENKIISEDEAKQILKSKEYFCDYIFGHDTALGMREKILEGMSAYKRVECAGRHRNNMPGGQTLTMFTKMSLMKKCKFSIAAESVRYPGFTSEKIGHSFDAHAIPVYFGDPDIGKEFNHNAFVDYNDHMDVDSMVKKVIEIDNDDDLYIHMLCQCRYNDMMYEEKKYKELETFLYHIFDQDREEAYRRPRFYRSAYHEACLEHYYNMYGTIPYRLERKTKYIAYHIRRKMGSKEEINPLLK